MAIFCLTESLADLKKRLGDIVIGYTRDKQPVTARDLKADGAMAVLLRDALAPNLVQTLEHTPAIDPRRPVRQHRARLQLGDGDPGRRCKLADYVVTEAGFGADLGAEKFIDIKCRASPGCDPSAVVRGGDGARAEVPRRRGGRRPRRPRTSTPLDAGMANLRRHLRNIREVYGIPCVVAINRFPTDTDAEVDHGRRAGRGRGRAGLPGDPLRRRRRRRGGAGQGRAARRSRPTAPTASRSSTTTTCRCAEKAEAIATRLYGAAGVTWDAKARRRLDRIEADGYGQLPVCVAKTQYSFSTDPAALGAPTGHTVNVREVRLAAGAGFVVLVTGDMMTMPGLPRGPASDRIDIDDDGNIVGLS